MIESNNASTAFARADIPDGGEPVELSMIRALLEAGDIEQSNTHIKNWLTKNPLCHQGFTLLGKVHEAANRFIPSVVAFQRALELREIHASSKPSEALSRLMDLEAIAIGKLKPLRVKDYTFSRLQVLPKGKGGVSIIGRSNCGSVFIKIEVCAHPLKARNLVEEADILAGLTDAGCLTAPRLLDRGFIDVNDLREGLTPESREILDSTSSPSLPFLVQDYLRADAGYGLADIALAMMEQKALGVFHGDIQPENIRFDASKGLCRFIDFDQAEPLPEEIQKLGNRAFFEWCSKRAREKYKSWDHRHFLAYFPKIDFDRDFWPLFRKDALNLAWTRLFRNQITTADTRGIYHSLDTPHVFIEGERNLNSRKSMLDQIDFDEGETVLDVGCGSGILSIYLAERGCRVTGVEIDAKLLSGSQIVAHLLRLPIHYQALDLDQADIPGQFDTIALFSVIHHTKNLKQNGIKVAEACRHRILIECRLQESGLKFANNTWGKSSAWDYNDLPEMIAGLEELFPGFTFFSNHGQGDRGRYLLEFRKPEL